MKSPTIVEMIESVIAKHGENQAFILLDIDRKSYYNYRKGGNPNRKVQKKVEEIYRQVSGDASVPYETKIPTDEAGLMRELLESQRARIKLLEERQQSETRLIQVEATLQIVVGILNGLKIPEQPHTPSDPGEGIGEVALRSKVADKNESSVPKVGRK